MLRRLVYAFNGTQLKTKRAALSEFPITSSILHAVIEDPLVGPKMLLRILVIVRTTRKLSNPLLIILNLPPVN